MPTLLEILISSQKWGALDPCLDVITSVLRRSAYISLLTENQGTLQNLIHLCAQSPWIGAELARLPVLLDELLDWHHLCQLPDPSYLSQELFTQISRCSPDDLEEQMEKLRYFKRSHSLKAASAEVTQALPLMKVSDYLTHVAESVLQQVVWLAWQQVKVKYGVPEDAEVQASDEGQVPFLVIAYGKMGGIELSYSSDLDLVFLYDAKTNGMTVGGKISVENSVFFARVAQRVLHILNTQTPSGALYDVDLRLRPDGSKGPLVSSLDAFHRYQQDSAWVWEHQALVRARPIVGYQKLQKRFELIRAEVLAKKRDLNTLSADVISMREKMRKHLLDKSGNFDMKQSPGGVVDIEFLVQYFVLGYSHEFQSLYQFTDNIRILEAMSASELMDYDESFALIDSYKVLRTFIHRLRLQNSPSSLPLTEMPVIATQAKEKVIQIWKKYLVTAINQENN